jgi:hypothetical protein
MFATDEYLFIGMPKCGCIYVRRVLEAAFGPTQILQRPEHTPLHWFTEEERGDRKIIGLIRNPFDWYVSHWGAFYQSAPPGKRYEFKEYYQRHVLDYDGAATHKTEDLPKPRWEMGVFTFQHVAFHFDDPAGFLADCRSSEQFESEYTSLLATDDMMRTEILTDEIKRVFGPRTHKHLRQSRNVSRHEPYASYYTPEMRDEIFERDGAIMRIYGYTF